MHTNKTDKFTYLFAKFFLYITAVNVDGLTPDLIITIVEEIQPQYVVPTFAYEEALTLLQAVATDFD